ARHRRQVGADRLDLALLGQGDPGDEAEQRRLARAGGADQEHALGTPQHQCRHLQLELAPLFPAEADVRQPDGGRRRAASRRNRIVQNMFLVLTVGFARGTSKEKAPLPVTSSTWTVWALGNFWKKAKLTPAIAGTWRTSARR